MTCDVISSGSRGNAVFVDGILLDCGVSFKKLTPYLRKIKLVLLTHEHKDHFNESTIRQLAALRPTVRFGCCEWLGTALIAAGVPSKRIDIYKPNEVYRYDAANITVSAFELLHDVPNCGYKFTIGSEKGFYATDTGNLNDIDAKGYDLYLIEANHGEQEIRKRMNAKIADGKFSYEVRAMAGHLSKEQADAFLIKNAEPQSKFCYLHQHQEMEGM